MLKTIALALLCLVFAVGAAACGGSDDGDAVDETTTGTTTDGDELASGREVFVANCGSCHTLADAGTSGGVGPNLDDSAPAADAVETQVREGGGSMPAFEGELSDDEIEQVSEYVATVAQG